MIRYRNGAYEVSIYIGKDFVTGKERSVSRSLRMPEQKRTPSEVLALEAKLRVERSQGFHGGPSITVTELLDRWIEHAAPNFSPTTTQGYRVCIARYITPTIGGVKLAKLSTAQLDGLYRQLVQRGGVKGAPLAPGTVRQVHSIIRRALHQAERWGWMQANVARLAEPPGQVKRASTTPDSAEIAALVAAAGPDLAFAIRLAYATGARRGELCGLRFTDVGEDAVLIARSVAVIDHKLLVKSTKSGRERSTPIGPATAALLTARKAAMEARAERFRTTLKAGAWVLSDDVDGAGPLNPDLLSDRFRRLSAKRGNHTRFHDLRHAAATNALAAGAPPVDVAAHLGHSSTTITLDTYGHPTPWGQRRVAEILDQITPL